MSRSAKEQALFDRFAGYYSHAATPALVEIERAVCGCDYGGTSWTTRNEANRLAEMLALAPGRHLLDIGAGSGWPALYLARITGCDATLLDVPVEGLVLAARRAAADGLDRSCRCVAGDAIALPFKGGSFHALGHSDVLCCLEAKPGVLNECRRVIRDGGRMVFTVISIAPGLSSAAYARAVEAGPPFKETTDAYTELLRRSGWHLISRLDLTAEYAASLHAMLREEEARHERLASIFGEAELAERVARRRNAVEAVDEGLLRRELFQVVPF
ncbi:MAG TPA: class I SAM-dependent methyltransferase [Alphaproteobacteria bacterium]|nr:class I SAM-dependent methyltransferase [Alphaproteobacteria bacterium]